jgi:type II secretory pathway pseudopilin PulG
MIVVVIIGILAAIAIPNFVRLQARAREASVMANMHTLQLAIEDYAVVTLGSYPAEDATVIDPLLPSNFSNPFGGATYLDVGDPAGVEGVVYYKNADGFGFHPYSIFGCGKDGATLPLVLTAGQ